MSDAQKEMLEYTKKKKETNMGPGLLNVVFDGETPINEIV